MPPKGQKRKHEQEKVPKRLDPSKPELLPLHQLQNLVRAAQKFHVGAWQAFAKTAAPNQKKTDPAAHTEEVLRAFVKHLLDGQRAEGATGAASDESTSSVNPAVFVKRYTKWACQLQKEQANKATSVPPPHLVKALNPPPAAVKVNGNDPKPGPTDDKAAPNNAEGRSGERLMSPWGLVHASRNHPKFRALYNLPSYMPGWARTKRRIIAAASEPSMGTPKSSSKASAPANADGQNKQAARGMAPRLLAIDCEMCETDKEQAVLVGLCVSDEQGGVLYKALVRPRGNIVNLRTELTGITKEDLDTKPTVTRSQARKAVKALLLESWRASKQPTILVGHALHHDLIALRLDHQPVIDTSLIFSYKGLPACTPGLRDLSQAVLQQDMPARGQGRHDSAEDAAVAMRLVLHELAQEQRTPPMDPPKIKVDKEELCKLLIHSIPRNATEKEVLDLFAHKPGTAAPAADSSSSAAGTRGSQGAASSSNKGDGDGDSSSEGSSSNSESKSDSGSNSSNDSKADEQPKKKRQMTPDQGTPRQQQKVAPGCSSAGRTKTEESSIDSSGSDSSEEEGEGEQPKKKQGTPAQGNLQQQEGTHASTSAAKFKGGNSISSDSESSQEEGMGGGAGAQQQQPPQPTGFEGEGIENGRAILVFRNPGDANTAFKRLQGTTSTDSNGRTTKEVALPGTHARSVKVRRMAAHNGLMFQVSKQARRPRPQKADITQVFPVGENGQPITRRDRFRQRELLLKKKKKPQELLAAQAKNMRRRAKREKKKERKAAAKEAKQKIALSSPGGVKMKRKRPFTKKTPAEKAAAAAAAIASGIAPQGGKKVTKKDMKKAAKRQAKAERKQKASTPKKKDE